MTGRDVEEYTALRATIRERGTTRVWLFVVGKDVRGLSISTDSNG